jgi:hypothetical protein
VLRDGKIVDLTKRKPARLRKNGRRADIHKS